ncbi:MAG: hypothetical protein QXE66_02765, partial [Desulfurococcaceae archaeon]
PSPEGLHQLINEKKINKFVDTVNRRFTETRLLFTDNCKLFETSKDRTSLIALDLSIPDVFLALAMLLHRTQSSYVRRIYVSAVVAGTRGRWSPSPTLQHDVQELSPTMYFLLISSL